MTAISELMKKFKKKSYVWYNFRNCLTCEHSVFYLDADYTDRMVCLKEHDIPKGLTACDDYKSDVIEAREAKE